MTNKTDRTYKTYRTYTIAIGFFIFYLLFFIFSPPAQARTTRTRTVDTDIIKIHPLCFQKSECEGPKYKGAAQLEPFCQIASSQHSQSAVDRQFIYSCFAPQPDINLQVSIGGYKVEGIEQYIVRIYSYFVGITGVVAGIMIIWAGVKWLTSGGIPDRISDAKKKIGNALIGMVLVLGSYVILQTINPALVNLRLPPVKMAREVVELIETECRNIPQFPCGGQVGPEFGPGVVPTYRVFEIDPPGIYQCDNPDYREYDVCGSSLASECTGIYCAGGRGCFNIYEDRITPDAKDHDLLAGPALTEIFQGRARECFTRSECQPCENVRIAVEEGGILADEAFRNIRLCVSAACDCILGVGQNDNLICTRRKNAGEACDGDAECQAGLECVPPNSTGLGQWTTAVPTTSTRPRPSGICSVKLEDGWMCAEDDDCQSGICGAKVGAAGTTHYLCTGKTHGRFCGPNGACVAPLHCVDTAGGNECYDGRTGSPCCNTTQCQSGLTCRGTTDTIPGGGCISTGTCRP